MNKYYKMNGEFTWDEQGKPNSNGFRGYIEFDGSVYLTKYKEIDSMEIQYFRGVFIDTNDRNRGNLILGFTQSMQHSDGAHEEYMYFQKLIKDKTKEIPMYYNMAKHGDGKYKGTWRPRASISLDERKVEITDFIELTKQQAKELKIKEFLHKNCAKVNASDWPLQTQQLIQNYQEIDAADDIKVTGGPEEYIIEPKKLGLFTKITGRPRKPMDNVDMRSDSIETRD